MIDPSARVHATADLEPNVSIGAGTAIWHRVQLRTGSSVGSECIIGRDVFSAAVVMVLVTTMVTPPLLRLTFPGRRRTRAVVEETIAGPPEEAG